MADPKREQLKVKNQKAVLAAVYEPGQFVSEDPLEELRGLVETAGVEVVEFTGPNAGPTPREVLA